MSPTTLTFTAEDWNAARTVTVTGVDDVGLGNRTALVTHSADGGGYNLADADTVAVRVTDDDAGALSVSERSVTVSEAGGTATYAVALTARPTGDVTVTAASSDTTAATVSPKTLTFTEEDWNTARTVTVTGVDDIGLGNRTALVTHSAIGGGYDLAGVDTVSVSVSDDEEAGLAVSARAVAVSEAGGTATYTVALTARPDRRGDGDGGELGHGGGEGVADGAGVHGGRLEYGADRDGDRGGRPRPGRPGGARHAFGRRWRLRPSGR